MCVCVREREKKRERDRERGKGMFGFKVVDSFCLWPKKHPKKTGWLVQGRMNR